jgi:membrane-bound lytic murein transglycosylase MltF
MTILPWREKILTLVPTYPTKVLLITPPGKECSTIMEMSKLNLIILKDSSYETILDNLEKETKVKFKRSKTNLGSTTLLKVFDGSFEGTLADANRFILFQKEHKSNLNSSLILSNIQTLSWGVAKENRILASILQKYLSYAKSTNIFNDIFIKSYNISFADYKKLIGL